MPRWSEQHKSAPDSTRLVPLSRNKSDHDKARDMYLGTHTGPIEKRAKPIKSKAHTKFIHELVCLICAAIEVCQHHLLRAPSRHGQYRAGDQHSVPLCDGHHRELHLGPGTENGFAERYGLNLLAIANFLWENTGDLDTCLQYIAEVRNG